VGFDVLKRGLRKGFFYERKIFMVIEKKK